MGFFFGLGVGGWFWGEGMRGEEEEGMRGECGGRGEDGLVVGGWWMVDGGWEGVKVMLMRYRIIARLCKVS